jgi:hypothetical protein
LPSGPGNLSLFIQKKNWGGVKIRQKRANFAAPLTGDRLNRQQVKEKTSFSARYAKRQVEKQRLAIFCSICGMKFEKTGICNEFLT